jgi:hypothetical protein
MKNPTIATVLNIIPGLGYIYIGGQKRVFGSLILLTLILSIIAMFDPLLAMDSNDPYYTSGFRLWDLLFFITFVVSIVAFMYDAYHSTLQANLKKQ